MHMYVHDYECKAECKYVCGCPWTLCENGHACMGGCVQENGCMHVVGVHVMCECMLSVNMYVDMHVYVCGVCECVSV